MFVYCITNKINGKKYIGQHSGGDLNAYFKYNISCALNNHTLKPCFYRAVRKHGPEAFEIKPLVIVGTKWEMDYYEKGMIKAFNTKAPNGYNLTDGGEGVVGHTHSAETRLKLSEMQKGKPKPPFTDEHKRNMSLARAGKPLPESAKQNMRGKVRTPEMRQHMSEVKSFKLPVDDIIQLYNENWSAREIGKMFGVSRTAITDRLRKAGIQVRSPGCGVYRGSNEP